MTAVVLTFVLAVALAIPPTPEPAAPPSSEPPRSRPADAPLPPPGSTAEPASHASEPAPAADSAPGRRVAFASGVVIDWSYPRVELETRVVLRSGPLELVACSPQSKEHESILVVRARPLHIAQALGMIGVASGSPVRYDAGANRWHPPTGDRLTITAEWIKDGAPRSDPIERWLLSTQDRKPVPAIEWVFAGSVRDSRDRLAADLEGTILCLVDFEAALIAPASLHSADNEQLWLVANTDAIPDVQTPVTLVLTPSVYRIDVDVSASGELLREDKSVPVDEIAQQWKPRSARMPDVRVALRLRADATADAASKAIASLTRAGIPADKIEVARPADRPPAPPSEPTAPPG